MGSPFFMPDPAHEALEVLAAEEPHEVVVEREEELGLPRVALASRAAAQLVVDAPALVALRTEDVEAAEALHLLVVLAPGLVLERRGPSGTPRRRPPSPPRLRALNSGLPPSLMSVPRPAMFVATPESR